MRYLGLLITLLTASFLTPVLAETYEENFDASTSLPEGWEVVGGTFYTFDTGATYYMNSDADYSCSKKNSLCCPVVLENQYLVSPKMTGIVNFYVRAYRSKRACKLRVFRCSDDGQVLGEEFTAASRSWTSSNTNTSWQQVSLNLGGEGTRLAFVMDRIYIDDFSGELYIDGEEVRGLSIRSVESLADTTVFLGDENNMVTLSFKATVQNIGTVDLTQEEENYTLSLLNGNGYELARQPIGVDIAAGKSEEIVVTATLEANEFITGKDISFAVRENYTETMQYCPTLFNITAYLPQLLVYDSDPSVGYLQPLCHRQIINFGNICEPLSGTFYVRNGGNAPLAIPTITAPEGFSVIPTSLKVEAGEVASVTLTLEINEENYGYYEGDVVFQPERIGEFYLTVKGTTRSPEDIYLDFSDQQFPMGWKVGSGWRIGSNFAQTNFYAEQYQVPVVAPSSLITPRLVVAEGDKMQFQACAYDCDEYYSAGLVVSYSADSTHWTTAADLTSQLTEEFQLFEITDIPAGEWYLRFRAINAGIDDIWGYRYAKDTPQLTIFANDPLEDEALQLTIGTTIDFGTVAEPTSRTIYIQNTGTGTLDITSITVPEGFGISLNSLQLTAGASARVVITLQSDTIYGKKSGLLRIEASGLEAFVLNLEGYVRDPEVFFVNFEDGQFPSGWYVGEGWQVTALVDDNNFCADNHNTAMSDLITPLLMVEEGDSLQFDAKYYGLIDWYPPTLHISYSADRLTWYSIADWTEHLSMQYTQFTLKEIPAGRWYIRFTGANIDLDNFEGYRTTEADLQPTLHFCGTVVDADSIAVSGAELQLQNCDLHYSATTDEAGHFELEVQGALAYDLLVTHEKCDTLTGVVSLLLQDTDTIIFVQRIVQVGLTTVRNPDFGSQQATYDLNGRRHRQRDARKQSVFVIGRRKVYSK